MTLEVIQSAVRSGAPGHSPMSCFPSVCAITCASWEVWVLHDPRVSESVFLIWVVLPPMGSDQPDHLPTVALVV